VRRLASDRFARRHREQGKSAFIVEADAVGSHPKVDSLEVKEEKASQDISSLAPAQLELLDHVQRVRLEVDRVDGHAEDLALSR
jgi:GntR family transcriptional regulator